MKVKAKRKFTHRGLPFEKGHVMDVPEEEARKMMEGGNVEPYEEPRAENEGEGSKSPGV